MMLTWGGPSPSCDDTVAINEGCSSLGHLNGSNVSVGQICLLTDLHHSYIIRVAFDWTLDIVWVLHVEEITVMLLKTYVRHATG